MVRNKAKDLPPVPTEHDSCGENQLLSDGIWGQLQRKRFKSRTPGQKLEVRPQALGEKPLLLLGYMGML